MGRRKKGAATAADRLINSIETIEYATGSRALVFLYREGGVYLVATDYKAADAAVGAAFNGLNYTNQPEQVQRCFPLADAACNCFPHDTGELLVVEEGPISDEDVIAFGLVRPSPVGPAPYEISAGADVARHPSARKHFVTDHL